MEFTGERVVPDKTPHEIYREHIDRYIFAADFVRNKDILDVACGTGYGVEHLAKLGTKITIGADISIESVLYANEKFGSKEGKSFVCADGISLPFADETFDIVISFETLEHIRQYNRFLIECRRVLREDGLFICSTPNKRIFSPNEAKPPNSFHVKEFWSEEFYNLLQQYYMDITLYGQCDVTLADNQVEREYGVHNFIDNEQISPAYIIAVANNKSCA
ncbi:MAG: class I SAM-dependent methyltransferase [Spirochaetota bacterium]|nr:class I SAM-dependent methyltransferase [Spirochaetota bacterium]